MPTQTAPPMAPPARSCLPTAKNGVDPGSALHPCAAPDDGQLGQPDVYAYTRLRQPRGSASTYHLKHDGAPDLVIEIISPSTWGKDVGLGRHTQLRDKKAFYRDIGVTEYWIYDPEGKRKDKICLFEGFRWTDGDYQRIEPDASGRWPSGIADALDGRAAIYRAGGTTISLAALAGPGDKRLVPHQRGTESFDCGASRLIGSIQATIRTSGY